MTTKNKTKVDTSVASYSGGEGWKFFVNDVRVSEHEYIELMDEHMKWHEEKEKAALLKQKEQEKEDKTKQKKVKIPRK